MNMESIVDWLRAVGVPAEVVSVGAEADNAWCLLRDDGGPEEPQPGWEVFWREQGNRYDWARFSSEHVACHYLFGRLTWSQVARGAVGVLPVANEPGTPPRGAVQAGHQGTDQQAATPHQGVPQQGVSQQGVSPQGPAQQGGGQSSPSRQPAPADVDPAEVTQPRTIPPTAGQANPGQPAAPPTGPAPAGPPLS